ncbi:OVARIAN TUMOR DOMAIN-containing deubiquitinating enzyme 3-like isoform X2 [Actinidia eriantha]|uniref:OVARIAN TUMOR DOMAIN-containing deubiquitinating enzyme 3-like isoform X2 n=1 Tax=Actinidia eriantha TaxID=165200 RepID=UPI00258FE27E|nr:OVARIAN TUMOR DOMAIN-containing deubiquitinating enzyme 3-like isoform X2 [Actinidia eriantha]
MALNKGITLNPREEREDADELRVAVKEVIFENGKVRVQYEEALVAITVEESLKRYCQRIGRSNFWGGESELLVLSKLCASRSLYTYQSMSIRKVDGAPVLFPSRSMDLSLVRVQDKENKGKL